MERSAKRPQGDQARSVEWDAKRRRKGGNDGTAGGASSTHTSTEGQEVVTSSGYDYEVFLSFRGPDTRAAFTDFLYTSLNDAGIRTFKDDEELRIGEEFAPELLQAIKQSKILIPIFSRGYASSVWCLKELVQMVECQKNGRQKIMPIFYDVDPSVIRYQTGIYAEAFLSHEEKQRYGEDTIREWKAALTAVGAINGWDLCSKTNRQEGKFAKEVTDQVFRELKKAYLAVSDCLVSVDDQVDEIKEMIGAQTSETRIIGINGMGGIGKTTIAKIIYNQLSSNFKDCCFLANIRETSERGDITRLQKQLIHGILRKQMDINNVDEGTGIIKDRLHNKRVLLLLDDVEKECHIDAFVGKRDWFGRGSRFIITTRNKDILCFPKVDCSYELKCMDPIQSLKLFSKHAFRRDSPLDEDMNQSNRAVGIARCLPLALEVIGSLLSLTKKENWDGILKELETVPPGEVLGKLKISFNALDEREQRIFMDMACLFVGYEKDVVIYFWDDILCPKKSMGVLESMSLMKIDDDNKVWMHDLVRDLGRDIVRQESKYKIEEQSRVWDPKEALALLRRQEKKNLEALRLHLDHQHHFTYEDFKRLPNLRFLEVCHSRETFRAEERLFWHESPSSVLPTNVFLENSNLLPQLRWLSWHYIPPTFKITNFSMEDVVILDLSRSNITHEWQGWSHMKVMKNLKVLNLTRCPELKKTPNFSAQLNLERLILSQCWNLVEIDESIYQLKHLVSLRADECGKLQRLTQVVRTDLATQQHCNSSKRLSDTIGNLESLIELDICYTAIEKLPDSIGKLKNLKVVKIGNAICEIPDALWMIKSLEEIKFEGKSFFNVAIDDCINENPCLRSLALSARIKKVPRLPGSLEILRLHVIYMDTFPDLSNLVNLKKLDLSFGGESGGPVKTYPMPRWIENISKLEFLHLNSNYLTTLPTDISSILPRLEFLTLMGAHLPCPPSLPSSLSYLWLKSECVTTLPTDMSSLLPRLETLHLECPNLGCVSSLPSSLLALELIDCDLLSSLGDLSNLKELSCLKIIGGAISEIRCRDPLENLQCLDLWFLPQLRTLPSLGNFNNLVCLDVLQCGKLDEIQGELPQSLEELKICKCGSLKELPDLSPLNRLKKVKIKCCGNLDVEAISSLCLEKSVEFVEYDSSLGLGSESEQEDDELESESKREGDEYEEEDDESEYEEEDDESEYEEEDDESEYEEEDDE